LIRSRGSPRSCQIRAQQQEQQIRAQQLQQNQIQISRKRRKKHTEQDSIDDQLRWYTDIDTISANLRNMARGHLVPGAVEAKNKADKSAADLNEAVAKASP
jgi:hypothetical protein